MYRKYGKRLLDLIGAMALLILFTPVLSIVAFIVRLRLGTPVLFRQIRPGFNGEPFTLLKFRTMVNTQDAHGNLLPDKSRLTPIGRFLRSTSLDELPELINVVRGEMSLVGPRPLLMRYLPFYTLEERARFDVRPGITGWAQIRGRNNSTWEQRLADDLWYVNNCSMRLDMTIMWLTITKVLFQENVQVDTASSMRDLDEERRNYGK